MTMKVYTGGTFDLFHAGHVEFLSACRRLAGVDGTVIVGLNRDEFIERFKGRRPVVPYAERVAVLTGCRFVDVIVENVGDEDSSSTIGAVSPDLLVIGSDWHGRDYLAQLGVTWEWLREHDVFLTYVPRVAPVSSTAIREALK